MEEASPGARCYRLSSMLLGPSARYGSTFRPIISQSRVYVTRGHILYDSTPATFALSLEFSSSLSSSPLEENLHH